MVLYNILEIIGIMMGAHIRKHWKMNRMICKSCTYSSSICQADKTTIIGEMNQWYQLNSSGIRERQKTVLLGHSYIT